jgi:hypothetical protein
MYFVVQLCRRELDDRERLDEVSRYRAKISFWAAAGRKWGRHRTLLRPERFTWGDLELGGNTSRSDVDMLHLPSANRPMVKPNGSRDITLSPIPTKP